ncbi:unnamed protein product [Discula destructiva]
MEFSSHTGTAGQIVIHDSQISRKHLTIELALVPEGKATDLQSRAEVTVEDLQTKFGTTVNGKKINGERFDLLQDANEIKLGKNITIRITWRPVVFSFNFSKAEMQQDVPAKIRAVLEPLDIKFVTNGRPNAEITHVISRKKNSHRVVEALINCQSAVNENFTDALVNAAKPDTDANGVETSPLEQDFEGNWPDAAKYVPAGAEWDDAPFAPDDRRCEVFDGYTFIFYDGKSHADLLPAITSGKGKALLQKVVPGQTDVDDFIRYVKGIAGEKGLGEFEDGSEGRGVVVVRHTPKGENEAWYRKFFNDFALRLDHRPIEKSDFLSAVLELDPAQLRRPLEVEPTPREPATQQDLATTSVAADNTAMEIDEIPPSPVVEKSPSPTPVRKYGKGRSQAKSRFKSFNVNSDSDDDDNTAPAAESNAAESNAAESNAAAESQGMFMTQQSDAFSQGPGATANLSQRKRPAPEPENNLMDSVAPTAARFKRQRLETGANPLPVVERTPPPELDPEAPALAKRGRATVAATTTITTTTTTTKKKARKGKKAGAEDSGDELLDQLVQTGQAEEANREAEDELLRRQLFEGEIDLGSIRQSTLVQTVAIRKRPGAVEKEEARWNPHWNGLKNFKKFRSKTEQAAGAARVRAPPKKILALEPVRSKEYGLSDNYWLEDEDKRKNKKVRGSGGRNTQSQIQHMTQTETQSRVGQRQQQPQTQATIVEIEEDDDASLPDVMNAPPVPQARSRRGKAAERASQQVTTTTRAKRLAVTAPMAERPAKRSRGARAFKEASEEEEEEEEDSEDGGGIGFRFGKRK